MLSKTTTPSEVITTDVEEATLVAAARADPRAFAPLYLRYVGAVQRYCFWRLADHAAAEDATSEVFLRVLAGLDGYRPGHFAAWLFRIAHNVVTDTYRQARQTAPLSVVETLSTALPTPEECALDRDRLEALHAALTALPAAQRQSIELYLAGCSLAESAMTLGTSLGALKMRRIRAFRRLRITLQQPV